MKKSIMVLCTIILMITLCSCGADKGHGAYKEIHKRYADLKSYYAATTVTLHNKTGENVYYVRQFFKEPGQYSMVVDAPDSIAGSGYTVKDGRIIMKSGFGHSREFPATLVSHKGSVCIRDFFEEYFKSEESFAETAGGVINPETRLDCFVSGRDEERFLQSLWMDNKTYLPTKMITYDINENPAVTVEFTDFIRNSDIDEKIFE